MENYNPHDKVNLELWSDVLVTPSFYVIIMYGDSRLYKSGRHSSTSAAYKECIDLLTRLGDGSGIEVGYTIASIMGLRYKVEIRVGDVLIDDNIADKKDSVLPWAKQQLRKYVEDC